MSNDKDLDLKNGRLIEAINVPRSPKVVTRGYNVPLAPKTPSSSKPNQQDSASPKSSTSKK